EVHHDLAAMLPHASVVTTDLHRGALAPFRRHRDAVLAEVAGDLHAAAAIRGDDGVFPLPGQGPGFRRQVKEEPAGHVFTVPRLGDRRWWPLCTAALAAHHERRQGADLVGGRAPFLEPRLFELLGPLGREASVSVPVTPLQLEIDTAADLDGAIGVGLA